MNHHPARSTRSSLVVLAGAALAVFASCDTGFGHVPGRRHLAVALQPPSNPGTREAPLAISTTAASTFRVVVKALTPDGQIDPTFNGYVRLSSKPGTIAPLTCGPPPPPGGLPPDAGRNVLLANGVSAPTDVVVSNAFGTTFILADDLGYLPADPLRVPPPQCANGIDDNHNGLVDYPADPGCAFANDDSEDGGSYEEGASDPLFFALPRTADVRGLTCNASLSSCSGAGITPYPSQPIVIDTGYHLAATPNHPNGPGFDFNVVITRVSASGFFFTDLSDSARGGVFTGFNSLYAYNYSTPPLMRICDRLRAVAGTASEFFGFTQLSYPTWSLEYWDPSQRPCLIPEPTTIGTTDIGNSTELLKLTAGVVRVQSLTDGSSSVAIASKLGPGNIPLVNGAYVPDANDTNCDFNMNGKIEFTPGSPEGACSDACTADAQCIEYSGFITRNQIRLIVTDMNGTADITADASGAAQFDPVANRGKKIGAFTGSLTYFSGGNQFTIEARCDDDVIVDPVGAPLPADKACVQPRTTLELNGEQ